MSFLRPALGAIFLVAGWYVLTAALLHGAARAIGLPGARGRQAWRGAALYCLFRILAEVLLRFVGIDATGLEGALLELGISVVVGTAAFQLAYGARLPWTLALALIVSAAQWVLAFLVAPGG